MNLLKMEDGIATSLSMSAAGLMTYPSKENSFKDNYLKDYYDILSGEYPQSKTGVNVFEPAAAGSF